MKEIRSSSEDEMILEFLRGEYVSTRFKKNLQKVLQEWKIDPNIIVNGNIHLQKQNWVRKKLLSMFRGYPNKELFKRYPKNIEWKYVQFDEDDIDKIYYINYDYWNELSNHTSKPLEAARNIRNGIEIYGVSNQPFLDGEKLLEEQVFLPVILLTCNEQKFLILEGHSRMTIYGLNPKKFASTYGYVGYCSSQEMKEYDTRMINT